MVRMLTDVHLAKAMEQNYHFKKDSLQLSSTDLYYSVLAKYGVPDSVFTRSVIYYSSNPKQYEKMYNDVINALKELEQENMELQQLNVGNPESKDRDGIE